MSSATLPPWLDGNKHVIRATVNPYDKSTIVSILPKPIDERKYTIFPINRYQLEPGSYTKPSVLVVGSSSWWKDPADGTPMLEIPCYSTTIAESIVRDYCQGYLGSNGDAAGPGLTWLPGEVTVETLKKDHKALLDKMVIKQKAWFHNLVQMADSLWARSDGNPQVIGEDMRMAARELGTADSKDWMTNFKAQDMIRCPACGTLANPEFPICGNCKAIVNVEMAKARNIQFAKV